MHIETTGRQSGIRQDIVHLLVLLVIAFCIGIYLISTTALISKDGITFIEYAKQLEVAPCETMKNGYQHPGYPFLILTMHRIVQVFTNVPSLWSWIYSAQIAALMFRLFTVVVLYFVGKKIVGPVFSFWAVLILVLLPAPAKLGSDAVSTWPYLFFLLLGFLLLIYGATVKKWWLFGFSGLVSGMGYLIRPECAQLIVFGSLWLGLQLFWSKRTISRRKAVFAFALLLTGFLIAAGPYMKLTGWIFPKKQIGFFALSSQSCGAYEQRTQVCSDAVYIAGFVPSDIAGAFGKLIERVGETLMWFFLPALLIGIYKYFRKPDWQKPQMFFMAVLIALNVTLVILLYCRYGYMSRRHTLPLVAFTIFLIPAGLQVLAIWLEGVFSPRIKRSSSIRADKQVWFFVLCIIGICVCIPKLLRPLRSEKQSYRDATRWLAQNTNESDIIATPDSRISFYAGRRGVEYKGQGVAEGAKYIVAVTKNGKDALTAQEVLQLRAQMLFSAESGNGKLKVVIYGRIH